jgi:thiamine biosynthesis lipoprotein
VSDPVDDPPLGEPVSASFPAIGTTATVLVTEATSLPAATALLRGDLAVLDETCSRFRGDSELRELEHRAGRSVPISPLLTVLLGAALRAARLTDGLVDPTVGRAMCAAGYDRDFAALAGRDAPSRVAEAAPGWWRVVLDPVRGQVLVPCGVRLDLGATAKAVAADRAARRITDRLGCGVLVSVGGDVAVAGQAPPGGWRVQLGDDHAAVGADSDPVVEISDGGLATSSVTRRTWRRGGRVAHHILDPRSGEPAAPGWRMVTVAAGSCLDANTASTAAIVLGAAAPDWLTSRGLPARLISASGWVVQTPGWPAEPTAAPVVAAGPLVGQSG